MKDLYTVFLVWAALLVGMAAADATVVRLALRRQVWRQPQAPCVAARPACGQTLQDWTSATSEVPTCQK